MRISYQFHLIQAIRDHFISEGFIDVLTPPMVENPGMETHIHPFKVRSTYKNSSFQSAYLHTSPEFCMKELLSLKEEELSNIFTISYCFRDEPSSPIHRNQFIMLEWYRKNCRYESIMDDCEKLIFSSINFLKSKSIKVKKQFESFELRKITVQDLFIETIGLDILDYLDTDKLIEKIKTDFKDVPLPYSKCSWDDYFFLLFLNKIEPELKKFPAILIYEFPAPLAALSTIKEDDVRVCERFEIFLNGVELCNCFNELTDLKVQKERFNKQNEEKNLLYDYQLPSPESFYETMQRGLPKCSGIALGVERFLSALVDIENPFYK